MPSLTSVYRTGERYVERELLSPEDAMESAFFYAFSFFSFLLFLFPFFVIDSHPTENKRVYLPY